MPSRHNPLVREYLAAFRAQLHGLSETERDDLVLELEDHILARLAEGMAPSGELLAASAAAHAATSAARAAQSAARADAAAKVTDLAAVRAAKAAARAAESALPLPAEREYPPELIAAVLTALGTPEELARRYVGPPPRRGRLQPRLARLLALIMGIGLLVVALAGRYALERRVPSDRNTITDAEQQQHCLDRLAAVCAAYRTPPQFFGKLLYESRIFESDCQNRHRVFHYNGVTHLVPYFSDGLSVRFSDTQTLVWSAPLRWYESLPPRSVEGGTYGPSLVLGLLTGKISDDQCRVRRADLQRITVGDSTIVFRFTGAYFGYGDGEYTVTTDRALTQLRRFTVRRLDTYAPDRSRYYTEHLENQRTDLPLTEEATAMPLAPDAETYNGLVGYDVRLAWGWKGHHLVGGPMPEFRMRDPRSGRTYSTDEFHGAPTLLVMASTWIAWDRMYLGALAELQRRYADAGLRVVVMAPEVDRRITEEYLGQNPLPYPFLTDYTGWEPEFYRKYRLYSPSATTPCYLAIGRDGRVMSTMSVYHTPMQDTAGVFVEMIASLVGRETVARVEAERAAALAALPESELLARADACIARDDDFTAREYLDAAIGAHGSLAAKLRLCRLYAEHRTGERKQLAEECLAETTASPYPYVMLGDYYSTVKHNYERAENEYAKALAVDSGCWLAHFGLGLAAKERGRHRASLTHYRHALVVNPDVALVHAYRALAHARLKERRETREAVRAALQFRQVRGAYPGFMLWMHGLRREAEELSGDDEAALATSSRALLYDPDDIVALRDYTRLLIYNVGRPAEALPVLDRMLLMDRNGRDYNYYGSALDTLGRHAEALAMFDLAWRYDPSIVYTWMNIGLTYEHMGDSTNARAAYVRGSKLFPGTWRHPAARLSPALTEGL